MSLFGRKKNRAKKKFTRIFYATDLHGSSVAYRKFLNAASAYKVDRLIMGGDISGKMLIPIITASDGRKRATVLGKTHEISTQEEFDQLIRNLELLGYYHVEISEDEYLGIRDDQEKVNAIFIQKARERLQEWIELCDSRFEGTDIRVYISGGNDDEDEVLTVLNEVQSEHVIPCEGNKVQIDELHSMVSLGISNPTPWDTPREFPEEVIAERIEETIAGIEDFTNIIFNFHVPPYDYGLDLCPELDTSTDPPTPVSRGGQQIFKPVGSTSVATTIEKCQPLLVLTGHIHECKATVKIGRTFAINPGSEYGEGILHGAIVNLGDGEIVSWQMTSG